MVWTPTPPKKSQIKGFLSNTGQDTLENQKATKLGHHRSASETPLGWISSEKILDPHMFYVYLSLNFESTAIFAI